VPPLWKSTVTPGTQGSSTILEILEAQRWVTTAKRSLTERQRPRRPALAQRVVDWLVQEEILDGQPRRWVFGDTGYLPGRGYHKATTHPESIWFHYDSGREVRHPPAWFEQRPAPDLSHLTREQREDISLSNVALRLKVGREVHYAIGSDVWCPKCGAPFSWFEHERGPGSEETHDAWLSAVTNWYEGGEGVLICPGCSRRMTGKDLAYNPPWGFG